MLAVAASGVVVVVCGAVVAALLLLRDIPSSDAGSAASTFPVEETQTWTEPDDYAGTETFDEPETYTETETTEETTEETTTDPGIPPDGFQQVSGPGGMTTYIPGGWPTKRASGPGAMQADDPSGTSILLRYGGSATQEQDTYQTHADYEQQFSSRSGYELLRLDRSSVREMSAVDWEFEYDPEGDVRRHVRSIYWLSQGFDYFVYVSAPVGQWPQAQEILDVMLDNATP